MGKYTIENNVTESKLDEFYQNNDFCIEGYPIDNDHLQDLADLMSQIFPSITSVNFFTFTGLLMNRKYDLEGDNAYKPDFHFLVWPLSTVESVNDMVEMKEATSARYFNDIVDNNELRECYKGRHGKNYQLDWLEKFLQAQEKGAV